MSGPFFLGDHSLHFSLRGNVFWVFIISMVEGEALVFSIRGLPFRVSVLTIDVPLDVYCLSIPLKTCDEMSSWLCKGL